MSFDWSFVLTTLPAFGQSVWVTLQLGAIVILTSLAVAILNVTLQSLHKPWLNGVIRAYVELARNTPLLIQLFFLYFGLPALGISLSGFATAVIAMTFLGGGYLTEALRAGVQAIPQPAGSGPGHRPLPLAAAAPRPAAPGLARQPAGAVCQLHLSAQRDHGGFGGGGARAPLHHQELHRPLLQDLRDAGGADLDVRADLSAALPCPARR